MKHQILHITAGSDTWTPTKSELDAIKRKFQRALLTQGTASTPVVVTRDAVYASIIPLEYDNLVPEVKTETE